MPKSMKFAGKYFGTGFAVWEGVNLRNQYKNGEIDSYTYKLELGSTAIGGIPVIGTFWTIGWEGGRIITNLPGYDENIRKPIQRYFDLIPPEPTCLTCPHAKKKFINTNE